MPLENQVCALEYAKRLKELGVKQNAQFWWQEFSNGIILSLVKDVHVFNGKEWAAFTVSELGEMLPEGVCYCRTSGEPKGRYCVQWFDDYSGDVTVHANTEANARCKMVVYLIENGLLKI